MKPKRSDSRETQERLLEAAAAVFAAKGFGAATVAEICRKARTNVASVNYHFGGKKNLYTEAWRYEFHKSIETYPPDDGVPPGAAAEERLRGRVRSILRRIQDPRCREFDFMQKEMAAPTGLLGAVARESIEPVRMGFLAIVKEMLGDRATPRQARLCKRSIMAQCFGILRFERQRRLSPHGKDVPGPPPLNVDVETLADHITRFSLAGIREVRKGLRTPPGRKKRSK